MNSVSEAAAVMQNAIKNCLGNRGAVRLIEKYYINRSTL